MPSPICLCLWAGGPGRTMEKDATPGTRAASRLAVSFQFRLCAVATTADGLGLYKPSSGPNRYCHVDRAVPSHAHDGVQ